MVVAALEHELMADEKVKTLSVKLHLDVIESARIVAAVDGVSMTDLLSDLLRPTIFEMERKALAKRSAATAPRESKQPKKGKGGGE